MGLRWVRVRVRHVSPLHLALVMAAVLLLFLGAAWAAAQASPEPASPPPQPSTPIAGQPALSGDALADDWPSATDYLSAALKFGLVLLILYGALWALRRYARTGFVRGATDSRRLALLETMPLAPRQALHLVRADDRTLLLGASERGITLLAEWATDDGRETMDAGQLSAAPSPAKGEGWGGGDSFTPALSLPLDGREDVPLLRGAGIARFASVFAQHLHQAIQRREQHAA